MNVAQSIRDRVAIVGMGCTRFGELWDKGPEDLLVEAVTEALADAGIGPEKVDAYWLGTLSSGNSGLTLSVPLKTRYKPVTRVENFCATGSEAFRNAAHAVAAGVYDVVVAVGVEKLKDSGYSGLVANLDAADRTGPNLTAPAAFALLAPAYFAKYGLDPRQGKEVLARIAWKNHKNGALNPRAQYQKEVPLDVILKAPMVAEPLGIYDCSGVADGAAAAVIVRAEDARRFRPDPVYVKAMAVAAGPGHGGLHQDYDFTTIRENVHAAQEAYRQAGITDPRRQIDLAEVHDCFTPTELILYEDLGFSERGKGWQDALSGVFDLGGELPVNPDGGLKSFGHPVGASGLRMMYEVYLQVQGRAGERQIPGARLGLTHNLGGLPWQSVAFVSILGREPGAP